MRLLITGICGFVGSAIAKYIKAHTDWNIIGLDNFIRPGSEINRLELKRIGIRVIHADIRCASDFEMLPAIDAVIDAAANPSVLAGIDGQSSSRQVIEHNLQGTINILEMCKAQRCQLILLSTSRVYSIASLSSLPVIVENEAFLPDTSSLLPAGLTSLGLTEDFSTRPPLSIYGSTKLASELLALEYGATFNFPVWINRCGVLAGGGQFGRADQGILAYWLNSWKQRKPLRYIGFEGNGYQVRDCLHPSDLARLILSQIGASAGSHDSIINVSGGATHAISLRQLSQWCQNRWGVNEVISDPATRPFDIPWMVLDSQRAQRSWSWKPEHSTNMILEEIAVHAETNPDWLNISAS